MFLLKKFLAAWLLPPFGFVVVAVVLLCVFWRRKAAVALSVVLLVLTLSLSLPIVANEVAGRLEIYPPISAADLASGQAIVILGGGTHRGAPEYGDDTLSKLSLERVRYGAMLARKSKLPVLITGGVVYGGKPEAAIMKTVLEKEFLLPVRWSDADSRNTAENASYSVRVLNVANIRRIVLVTHAWHMPRAKSLFEQQGIAVIPAPTGFAPRGVPMFELLLPSTGAFERSSACLREWVARLLT